MNNPVKHIFAHKEKRKALPVKIVSVLAIIGWLASKCGNVANVGSVLA